MCHGLLLRMTTAPGAWPAEVVYTAAASPAGAPEDARKEGGGANPADVASRDIRAARDCAFSLNAFSFDSSRSSISCTFCTGAATSGGGGNAAEGAPGMGSAPGNPGAPGAPAPPAASTAEEMTEGSNWAARGLMTGATWTLSFFPASSKPLKCLMAAFAMGSSAYCTYASPVDRFDESSTTRT
jgi:hypothetical protein